MYNDILNVGNNFAQFKTMERSFSVFLPLAPARG